MYAVSFSARQLLVLVTTSTVLWTLPVGAQEPVEPPKDLKFEPYLKLVKSQYFPPAQAGSTQVIRLTFDLSPDVPVQTKIHMQLLHTGLAVEETVFQLKNNLRQNVTFDWKPKKRLGVDNYFLQIQMPLAQQVPAVQAELKKKNKRFPLPYEPWAWSYQEDKYAISVGTPEERAEQNRRILKWYDDKILELTGNWNAFDETLKEIEAGKKFKRGSGLNKAAFEEYLKGWCKKQASIQKSVKDLMLDDAAMFDLTKFAHQQLEELGRMVSKDVWRRQLELTKKHGLNPFQLKADLNSKSDEVLRYFDRAYRFKVDMEELNKRLDKIDLILAEFQEKKDEAEEAGKKKGQQGGKGKATGKSAKDAKKGAAPKKKGS